MSPKAIKKFGLAAISGIVSNQAISEETGVSYHGSKNLRIDIEVSGVTVVGSITAKIQGRTPGGSYTDYAGANASVSITGNGSFSIRQNIEVAADQANMPLHKNLQVVLTTTNAGDQVTVGTVYITQG